MTPAVVTVCFVCVSIVAYIVGRWHERQIQADRRPGYLPLLALRDEPEWAFSQVPAHALYDQERELCGDSMLLATIGHPLAEEARHA